MRIEGSAILNMSFAAVTALTGRIWLLILLIILALFLLAAGIRAYIGIRTRTLAKKSREAEERFRQTAEAFAAAVDSLDPCIVGHSFRVADYARRIAEAAGKSKADCEKIYYCALLHDAGMIDVPAEILTKNGKLTEEETDRIRKHPLTGSHILERIGSSPWLALAARYHHERYDGKGYPEGLKREEIPESARIIAVADAYDAMTSDRSYRPAMPQHIVRKELMKGSGTQFDPVFDLIMIHMLDLDTDYRMRDTKTDSLAASDTIRCERIYEDCSGGISVTTQPVTIRFCSQPDEWVSPSDSLPTLILFDSLDGNVHPGEEDNQNLLYYEYARIRMDGLVTERNTRKTEVRIEEGVTDLNRRDPGEQGRRYLIEGVRYRDHARIRICDENRTITVILALPDMTRFTYLSIGGEHCSVSNIRTETANTEADNDTIPRIAEEISYIRNSREGNIPNIQINGMRTDATEGIAIGDGLTLRFHMMSLPTARLMWHCAFLSLFSSKDGRLDGKGFREYLLLRLDGESSESDEHVQNEVHVEKNNYFYGWDDWIRRNKEGVDCAVTIAVEDNRIIMQTETNGIAIRSVTMIRDKVKDLYIALTGDQCAITDIRIERAV